jgi:hypothetical protein
MQNFKPKDIYERFQRQFIESKMKDKTITYFKRFEVKLRGYYPKDSDLEEGVIEYGKEKPEKYVNPLFI